MKTLLRLNGRTIAVSTVLAIAGVAGCSSQRATARDEEAAVFASETPPGDFAIAVTVFPRASVSRRAGLPLEKRPARYIVQPDWILRARADASVEEQAYPNQTRQLSQSDMSQLWLAFRSSGLADGRHAAIVGRVPSTAGRGEGATTDDSIAPPVIAVSYTAGGVRKTLSLQGGDEAAAFPLVKMLAGFAWMPK